MAGATNPGVHASWRTRAAPDLARIDVAGFVGIAARGPIDAPVPVESWPQFVATFGDFQANAFLGYALRGFFDNGGARAFVTRVVAPARTTATSGVQPADGTSSKLADTAGIVAGALATLEQVATTTPSGVQPADRLRSVVASVAGFAAGARVALRQAGKPPLVLELTRVDAPTQSLFWSLPIDAAADLTQPFSLTAIARDVRLAATVAGDTVTWTRPLDARFDLDAPIAVGFGAGVAGATLWDEQGAPLLAIRAASPGRWGDGLSVRLTTSLEAEIATRRRATPDPADRLTLTRVIGLAAGASVDILQDGAATMRNTLRAIDTAAGQVVLEHALAGFDLAAAADGTKPIRLRRRAFALSVRERGRLVETFTDLDLPTLAAVKASPVNARSAHIRIERVAGSADRWLDPGSPLLDRGEARLWGGRDGVAMLRPRDFTGGADELVRRGLAQFEAQDEPAGLALPDLQLPPTPGRETLPPEPVEPDPCALCPAPAIPIAPPPFAEITEATPTLGSEDVLAVQQALVEHCEGRGDRVALLDPPLDRDFDLPVLLDWRQRFDSSYAVAYAPWVRVADPIAVAPARERLVPMCGHALGQFAAADADPGRDAPANRPLVWASGVGRSFDDTAHAMLNERGINAVLVRPGRGLRIMGARTLSSAPDWQQLVVRRLLLRLKRSLALALRWAVFEPADTRLADLVVATIESLLEREWEARRLAGASAQEAFQVSALRSADDVDAGRFIVEVAVAPALPAEFIYLTLVRSLDRLELAEASAAGGWPQ